ncbi:hypothetical protein GGH96_000362 [Coemansia sp. RSA 1972]|nr:hypothetical protein GGH96_000362 [Coemansia sp. RSA 1972]
MKFGAAYIALVAAVVAADDVSVNGNQAQILDAMPRDLVAAMSYFPATMVKALMLGNAPLPTDAAAALALAPNMPEEERQSVSSLYDGFIAKAGSLLPTPTETAESTSESTSSETPSTTTDSSVTDSSSSDSSSDTTSGSSASSDGTDEESDLTDDSSDNSDSKETGSSDKESLETSEDEDEDEDEDSSSDKSGSSKEDDDEDLDSDSSGAGIAHPIGRGYDPDTGGYLARLADLYQRQMDIMNRGLSGTLEEYQNNLHAIISLLRDPDSENYSPDTRILVITPPPIGELMIQSYTPTFAAEPFVFNNRTRLYAEMAKQVAHEAGVPSIDLYSEIENRVREEQVTGTWSSTYDGYDNYLVDGIHLNNKGNMLLYNLILTTFKAVWPEMLPKSLPS